MSSDSDAVHQTELPKIVDDGTYNNYGEWETKSYHKLRGRNLLKYIEGATSQPPIIPPLRQTVTHHGVGDNGHLTTIRVPGNLAEHEQAVSDAEPWMTGNNNARQDYRGCPQPPAPPRKARQIRRTGVGKPTLSVPATKFASRLHNKRADHGLPLPIRHEHREMAHRHAATLHLPM